MAALVAGMARAGADIIGMEQEGVGGMEDLVAFTMLAEQELLEEPGGMGAMPLRRTRVRHGLDQLVLGGQGGGPALGLVPHGEVDLDQPLGEGSGIGKK